MGQRAVQSASQAAAANALRAAQIASGHHRQSFVQASSRRAPRQRRRRSLPVRLVGLIVKLAFLLVWLAIAAAMVAFAIQQSNGG